MQVFNFLVQVWNAFIGMKLLVEHSSQTNVVANTTQLGR